MKRLLFIFIMLVIVVAASGCTSQQNATSNKTYSANGISFNYNANWTEQNSADLQSKVGSSANVLGEVGDGSNLFGIEKLLSHNVATINAWASNYNASLKNNGFTYVSEKSLKVDGVNAYQITAMNAQGYLTDVFFVKNDTGYVAIYSTANNNTETLDLLMKSLKVS